MHLGRLIVREIAHRKLNFALTLVSVTVAVGCLVGATTLLEADRVRTDQAGAELEDDTRKAMTKLGFNILVLPQEQDLNRFHVDGEVTATMPESYVEKLANSDIMTVNHLLPIVSKRVRWPEKGLDIILAGTRGEVPQSHRDMKKPLQEAVSPGSMVVGDQVHQKLGLSPGDRVTLLGREFTVEKTHGERGTADDSTVWLHLAEAQELLGMQNLVNAILALECNCASADRLGEVRQEISAILPGTQILERGDKALARAEARSRAKLEAEKALQQHEQFAAVLVPLVLIVCGVWIAVLSFGNVRQRRPEIGVLRAIGFRSKQIFSIFLGKAVLIGLLGAVLGYAAGIAVGNVWSGLQAGTGEGSPLSVPLLLLAVVTAPALAALASWIPAMLAAQQDPALVLSEES